MQNKLNKICESLDKQNYNRYLVCNGNFEKSSVYTCIQEVFSNLFSIQNVHVHIRVCNMAWKIIIHLFGEFEQSDCFSGIPENLPKAVYKCQIIGRAETCYNLCPSHIYADCRKGARPASFLPKIARESGKSYGHRRINRSYRPIKTRRTGRRQLLTRSYNFPMAGRLFFYPTRHKWTAGDP